MSIEVRVPTVLRTHTDGEKRVTVEGATLAEAIDDLESRYPGLGERLRDEEGNLARFVNVYVNDEDVRFLGGEQTELADGDQIAILPAVAGG